MTKTVHLVVVDPQNSFCSVVDPAQQQAVHDGEICVPGAAEDMKRVAVLISRLGTSLADIHITLESRHALHVSHPIWFRDSRGATPAPFTVMREENRRIIGRMFGSDGGRIVSSNSVLQAQHPTANNRLSNRSSIFGPLSARNLAAALFDRHGRPQCRPPTNADIVGLGEKELLRGGLRHEGEQSLRGDFMTPCGPRSSIPATLARS